MAPLLLSALIVRCKEEKVSDNPNDVIHGVPNNCNPVYLLLLLGNDFLPCAGTTICTNDLSF